MEGNAMRATYLIGTAMIGLLAGGQAAARMAPVPAPAAAEAATADAGLEEIVVTAQRRSESLQKAAIPVDVVTGAALMTGAVTTSGQLGSLIPSLSVQNNGGANTTFFLRGVGNFTVNGYSDPAIAFNYDGVYLGRPTSTAGMFYDLERVEVLKGPQGTLYGRNATGGAINVLPAKPVKGETSAFASLSYGNYDAINAQGAINLGLGEHAGFRLSGNVVSRDGYLSDGMNDEKTQALRAQLAVDLTPDLKLRIGADWSHNGGQGVGASYAESFGYNPVAGSYVVRPSGLSRSTGLYDPASIAYRRTLFAGLPGRTLGALDPDVYQDNSFWGVKAEVEYRTDAGTFTVIPAARFATLDNRFPTPAFIGFIQEDDSQYSLEARFASERVGIFDLIAGGYFFDERVQGNYTFSQDALSAIQDFTSKTRSYAAFGRVTAHVGDNFRLVGGLRYTKDEKDFSGLADVVTVVCTVRVAGVPSCPNAPVIPVVDRVSQIPFAVPAANGAPAFLPGTGAIVTRATTPVDERQSPSRVTYRAAAEYDLGPSSLVYASYETGYRSGGFSLSFGKETFEPEYIDAFTIGSKNRLFDNSVQLNIEAFYWKYRNQQVNHTGIDLRGNQGQFTENVGRSTNKGAEVELQWRPLSNTLLNAQVQYLKAKYSSFAYTVPVGNAPPYVGCPVTIDPATPTIRTVDCSGRPSYQSPKWTINLGGQQTIPVGDYKFVAQADTQYKSSRYVGFEYLDYQRVGSTWSSNAQLSFGPADDRWSIAGFVRNIEDNRIVTAAPIFNIGGVGTVVTAPPRTYGLRVMAKY
jgi:iron complex outermembrane receptor protein